MWNMAIHFPFGAPGRTPSHVCRMGGGGCDASDCLIPLFLWTNMDHKKFTAKNGEALAEFKFCHLGNIFMESSDDGKISLCKILYFVRGTGLLME
jgi:hypothetical protein